MEILVTKKAILKFGAAAITALTLMSASAFATKVVVVISKVSQHMTVTVDGQQQYNWLVSTGGAGYETPSGTFHPFRLEKEHFSKEWDDAPMPYSMFFTGEGHAIHGSYHIKRLGTRASHGCVRLHPENAHLIYNWVSQYGLSNTTVVVSDNLGKRSGFGLIEPAGVAVRPSKPIKPTKPAANGAMEGGIPLDAMPLPDPTQHKKPNFFERLIKKLNHEA